MHSSPIHPSPISVNNTLHIYLIISLTRAIVLISSYPETVTSFLNRGGAFIHSSGINSVRSTAESLLPSGKSVKKVDVRDEEELKEKLGDFVSSTAGAGSGTTETAAISAGGGGQGQLKFARPTRPGGKKR